MGLFDDLYDEDNPLEPNPFDEVFSLDNIRLSPQKLSQQEKDKKSNEQQETKETPAPTEKKSNRFSHTIDVLADEETNEEKLVTPPAPVFYPKKKAQPAPAVGGGGGGNNPPKKPPKEEEEAFTLINTNEKTLTQTKPPERTFEQIDNYVIKMIADTNNTDKLIDMIFNGDLKNEYLEIVHSVLDYYREKGVNVPAEKSFDTDTRINTIISNAEQAYDKFKEKAEDIQSFLDCFYVNSDMKDLNDDNNFLTAIKKNVRENEIKPSAIFNNPAEIIKRASYNIIVAEINNSNVMQSLEIEAHADFVRKKSLSFSFGDKSYSLTDMLDCFKEAYSKKLCEKISSKYYINEKLDDYTKLESFITKDRQEDLKAFVTGSGKPSKEFYKDLKAYLNDECKVLAKQKPFAAFIK